MTRAYRIVKEQFIGGAFSGEGARIFGGRWNEKGTRLVYCSSSVSLAMLEVLVHTPELPKRMMIVHVTIPDRVTIDVWNLRDLPSDWAENPAPSAIKALGEGGIASGKALALRVPSAVVQGETNILINPLHADWSKCEIGAPERVRFDTRLKPP